eukprot:10234603-Lingulodinium_polyedra.AAC.1
MWPPWVEKRADMNMFDPEGVLFRGGAHMPLFGFLGSHPRRSDVAILRREQRFCQRKGKTSLKGKGKGKPRVAMDVWAKG